MNNLMPQTIVNAINETLNDVPCINVHQINNSDDQCEFIRNTESCSYDGFIYSYNELAYCQMVHLRPISYLVLFAILGVLFISMGIVADDFLCPSLLTISKTLRLPDNIAGVTFLAFGNGAPDIFASIGGIRHSKPQLIFSSLYGAGIFVTTIVTGSILLVGEFQVMKRPLIRDITFYIGATFIVWLFIFKNELKLGHAIALVCYYLAYILTIAISRFIYLKYKLKTTKTITPVAANGLKVPEISIINEETSSTLPQNIQDSLYVPSLSRSTRSSFIISEDPESRKESIVSFSSNVSDNQKPVVDEGLDDEVILARFYRTGTMRSTRSRSRSITQHFAHHHWSNTIRSVSKAFNENIEQQDMDKASEVFNKNDLILKRSLSNPETNPSRPTYVSQFSMIEMMSETKNFIIHACPIDILEWNDYSNYKKILELIKAVPYFLMTICIPVVDLETINENWCRLLTCLNILLAPQIVLFLKQVDYNINDSLPLWCLLAIISIILIIIVFLTSNKSQPPIYHRLLAFIGFGISVLFINTIADEIINILQTFGVLLKLSDSILGLTILAWGNSLGDLISNLSMARHGYHSMAIAACFGGPMLNLLIGLGVPYLILFVHDRKHSIELNYTNMITLLYATITISLCTSLASFLLRRFKSSRIHGFLLILIYICYLITAVVFEFKNI